MMSNQDTIYSFLCQYIVAGPAWVPQPARTDAARPTQIHFICRGLHLFPPLPSYIWGIFGKIFLVYSKTKNLRKFPKKKFRCLIFLSISPFSDIFLSLHFFPLLIFLFMLSFSIFSKSRAGPGHYKNNFFKASLSYPTTKTKY